jgi:hypothetical protein
MTSGPKRWIRWTLTGMLTLVVAYTAIIIYPQPLFAYELEHAGIVVHATQPIPEAMRGTLERARARLNRSTIADPARVPQIFMCQSRWLFALFARTAYNAGGLTDVVIGQNVFLRESDMEHDRLIGASGRPTPPDRPLSYFIAHEIMHLEHGQLLGRMAYLRLEKWADDGHADYVARDIDLAQTLQAFKTGARELDPARSGLYLRYQLMVAYLVEKKHVEPRDLLEHPPDRAVIERELAALQAW